VPPQMQE